MNEMILMEFLSKDKANHCDQLRTHAQFLSFSDQHSSLKTLVRHLGTSFVSPQYHLVFKNKIETVYSAGAVDEVVNVICKDLFENNCDWQVKPVHNEDGVLVYEPSLLNK
ncbi:hypothetical protein ACHAWF_016478, partial [Thalassiosira exigua]